MSISFFIDKPPFLCYIYFRHYPKGLSPLGVSLRLSCEYFDDRLNTHCDQCEFCEDTQHCVKIAVDVLKNFGSFLFFSHRFHLPSFTVIILYHSDTTISRRDLYKY